ncbi:MAG: hypothetical protein QG577_1520 [Thermodesulfobacteriota bacterium]|nr:hypothetical protein [Thermodesulfobacteriota bacterium]
MGPKLVTYAFLESWFKRFNIRRKEIGFLANWGYGYGNNRKLQRHLFEKRINRIQNVEL